LAGTPEPFLRQIAAAICNVATPNLYGFNQSLLVLAGDHTEIFRTAGWDKARIRAFVMDHARQSVADLKRAARLSGEVVPEDETAWRAVLDDPADLLIVRAGGRGGAWSAVFPGWGKRWTRSITTRIERT
jgi:hypothetical protein